MTSTSNFLTLFCFSCQVHVNIITGSGKSEIRNTHAWVFPKYGDWGELWIPNLVRISLIECHWMLQNSRVTAFAVFELLRENQLGGGGKFNPPTQIQGCFIIFAVRLLAEALQKLYIPSQITIIFVIAFYIMRHLCYPENKQNQELKMPDVLK